VNIASFLVPLLGGVLVGLAVAALLLLNGRVAGISGIVSGLLGPLGSRRMSPGEFEEWGWRALFVLGLVAGGAVARLVDPGASLGATSVRLPVLALAGALVGFGTRLAGGCTSGHGVCGVSRLSLRSIAATATFMAAAALVVFVVRHGWGRG
jgi:uncharacterized membrane protein YedE/YeeE